MWRSDVRTPGVALECAKACQAVKVPPVSKSICIPSLEYALNLAEAFKYQQKKGVENGDGKDLFTWR
jgi:hypothetical protein